ncbi:MAG TPA: diacylglycerol kinase family protein [Acidimicrobiia bacterium]|nr:diacylglycerol kinase family protein [Acidimicrobiia bacterium]
MSGRRSGALDIVMPRLSRAADHSLIWFAIAAGLGAFGGRVERRAALRGVIAIAGASAISSGILKRLLPRRRPSAEAFPFVGLRRRPVSSSMPSGHAASAAAFAAATTIEVPALAAPVGALAAAVAYSRVYNGVHYPGDVLFGSAIGLGVAAATTKVWPRVDHSAASARPVPPRLVRVVGKPSADGAGLTVVVNPRAHSGRGKEQSDELVEALPAAKIVELDDPADMERALHEAAADALAIGVIGGDGSINTAVGVALEHRRPLLVVPGGTLNHFARDLGLDSVDDSARAVKSGQLVAVDVGCIDGRAFVNTASFGSYSKLVEAREKLEDSIGKWAALGVALTRVLREYEPFEVTIDGRACRVWMIFIGNCTYEPSGFAPSTRTRLDDGLFDVRVVDGSEPWARVRLIVAALTGNLVRSKVYSRRLLPALDVHITEGDHMLAADGEVFAGHLDFTVEKHPEPLLVYVPE